MDRFVISANTNKQAALQAAAIVSKSLERFNCTYAYDEQTAEALGAGSGRVAAAQCAIVIGGDGTILRRCAKLSELGMPVLGVNLGNIGYLTEIEPSEIDFAVDRLISGDFTLESRMLLAADFRESHYLALNDFVVYKSGVANTVQIAVAVDDVDVFTVTCDGLIVSTPTGSTAYSLSAGGPVIAPDADVMLITPVAPHALSVRPLVLDKNDVVGISLRSNEATLACDGRTIASLRESDDIKIRVSEKKMDFVRLKNHNYFKLLRQKLY